ncbi:MAG: DUF2309 family protein, partial [Alphaproteobacteria bacterium]|nr:DUF2309 family protein [Alphaproteobacteria bacterium]
MTALPVSQMPDFTDEGAIGDADILSAADRAGKRIAPLWPLKHFVAVNPFWGLADHTFAEAAEVMGRTAGARMTMPRSYYLEAIETGRITRDDIAEALGRVKGAAVLADADAVIAAARQEAPLPSCLPTVADMAAEVSGKDWPGFITERISLWAADQFDEGQASWPPAGQTQPPYVHWREMATVDRTPEFAGMGNIRSAVAHLPEEADGLIVTAMKRLGLDEASMEPYLHRLLMTVGGWAAYARYKLWDAELYDREDETLRQFLAVRLAWELILFERFQSHADFAARWGEAYPVTSADGQALAIDAVLQTAYDGAWQRELVGKLDGSAAQGGDARKKVQAAFCIDVRSEVFRRSLETVAPEVETIGFAGFFGFAIEYIPIGKYEGGAQCPVLLTPQFTVRETVRDATPDEEIEILGLRRLRRRASKAWKSFKLAAVSSFAFVETVGISYLVKLISDATGLSRTVTHPASDGLDASVETRLMPEIETRAMAGRETGFTPAQQLDMAEGVLKAMSMTSDFARIVLLAGHGATVVNNPHASGLDCGACGGHTGEANARVAAAILNDPEVREGLAERGIHVPEDTVFIGALHDTTTDEVELFDLERVPASHADDVAALKDWLARAGHLARAERSALLNLDSGREIDAQVIARSQDWAQVRPEWGLAGCAAFIAAPRSRTVGRDLDGRSFLHNYDWRQDEGFGILELIMTAPMVVASWISLQYYGSTVDNRVFGCGDKVLHNVVGTLGVLEGNGGDLRTGLPWQSVHDGERLIHEPLRLS